MPATPSRQEPTAPAQWIIRRLLLRPTQVQQRQLQDRADAFRQTWNWALDQWDSHNASFRDRRCDFFTDPPSARELIRLCTDLKKVGRLPAFLGRAAQLALSRNQAIKDVEVAWARFERGGRPAGPPQRDYTAGDGFYLHNESFRFSPDMREVHIQGGIGGVALHEPPDRMGRTLSARIVRERADRWLMDVRLAPSGDRRPAAALPEVPPPKAGDGPRVPGALQADRSTRC